MLTAATLPAAVSSDPALDHAQLFARGLEQIRRYSRLTWTDHNTHDPGITILELACYVLTDLAYRAQFPLEDLLTRTINEPSGSRTNGLVTPRQALPNRPLTAADYRKLVIDVPGVRNAWIEPAASGYFVDRLRSILHLEQPTGTVSHPVILRGLYRVRLDYWGDSPDEESRRGVNREVLDRLQSNRCLCEEFVDVVPVEVELYALCADIELQPAADPSRVAADLQWAIDQYLAPPVNQYSLDEMLARRRSDGRNWTVPEIFEGPRLEHGFIDDDELIAAQLRRDIRLSDIHRIIMETDGVHAIREAVMNGLTGDGLATEPDNPWQLEVTPGCLPRLDPGSGRLIFRKRGLPVAFSPERVAQRRQELEAAQRTQSETTEEYDLPVPPGRDRHPGNYHSFQNHFPALYGLSADGLASDASPKRKAQALQLKGYLLLLEQMFANFLAQLERIDELLSPQIVDRPTMAAQVVRTFSDYEAIYPPGVSEKQLTELLEDEDSAFDRRNRFLDHLLARFGEDFHEFVAIMESAFGATRRMVLAEKCRFLAGVSQGGGDRALAANHSPARPESLWDTRNVSGLERRLRSLLGIRQIDWSLERPGEGEFRFRIHLADSAEVLQPSVRQFPAPEMASAAVDAALELLTHPEAYARDELPGGAFRFRVLDAAGDVVVSREFLALDPMEKAITWLIDEALAHQAGESLFLIENIRLRPIRAGDLFLPICVDPGCHDCAGEDPYSYRLQVILTADAGRLANPDFREFVEQTIRKETPAHLLPRICWIDRGQRAQFEPVWRAWVTLPATADAETRTERLNSLVLLLTELRRTFPPQRLTDCGSGPEIPPFVLDRSPLGDAT